MFSSCGRLPTVPSECFASLRPIVCAPTHQTYFGLNGAGFSSSLSLLRRGHLSKFLQAEWAFNILHSIQSCTILCSHIHGVESNLTRGTGAETPRISGSSLYINSELKRWLLGQRIKRCHTMKSLLRGPIIKIQPWFLFSCCRSVDVAHQKNICFFTSGVTRHCLTEDIRLFANASVKMLV